MTDPLGPIEHYLRRRLPSERDRQRFDRAKRFVNEVASRGTSAETALRVSARWLKFLCSRAPVQTDVWPEDTDFLRHFAADFGLPPSERRKFLGLSLLGRLWRALYFDVLAQGSPELLARLTHVVGWDHFSRCRDDGVGLILLVVHGQFVRLSQPYLRHRGHDSLDVGVAAGQPVENGAMMPVAQSFELARQMHAAKHLLARGGLVFNPPDARQNLDHSRTVEFFGRQRQLAAGFAELALKTGARMMPIAYRFTTRGSFVLEFGAPFHVPGAESPHDERVDSLVGQYASFLRDQWRFYPWNIPWKHLLHYCQSPVADPSGPGEELHAPGPPQASSSGSRQEFAR